MSRFSLGLIAVFAIGFIACISAAAVTNEELEREILRELLRAALEDEIKEKEADAGNTAKNVDGDVMTREMNGENRLFARRRGGRGKGHHRGSKSGKGSSSSSSSEEGGGGMPEPTDNGLPDCTAGDFGKCQLAGIQSSIDTAGLTSIPIFIRCEMLRGLSDCDASVLETCNETPDLIISDNVAEVHGRIKLLEGNCSCLTSAELHPDQCTDQCAAQPCINGGVCAADDAGTFKSCDCPEPYYGEFCQYCDGCDKCDQFNDCECEDGKGGPFCNIDCADFDADLVPLYRACVQIANDFYFRYYPYPSLCVFALILDECIAASASTCGRDVRGTLAALDLEAGFDQAKFNLDNGICKIGGQVPFNI